MMDETILRRKLTIVLLFFFVAAIAFYAVKSGSPLIGGLLLAFPVGIFFLSRPVLTAVLVPMAYFSKLMIPGIAGSFTLNYMLQMVLIVWWLGSGSLHRIQRRPLNMMDRMVLGYALTLLLTMAVRGFGIRMMGSMAYGGMAYFYMFLWIGYYFACRQIVLLEKQVNHLLLGLCFSAGIPVLLLLLVFFNPQLLGAVSSFTTTAFDYLGEAVSTGEMGKARWGAAAIFAEFLIYYALSAPFKKKALQKRVLLLAVAILAALSSGFRSTLAGLLLVIVAWALIKSKNKAATAAVMGVVLLLFWGAAFLSMDYLPENMQRTVSMLPGIKMYGTAADSALQSINWRLDVWALSASHIPEYLFIGRGLVSDVSSAAWMQSAYYVSPEFAYMMSNYHSGPLSIILTFGLPGVITFLGLPIAGILRGIATLRRFRSHRDTYSYTLLQFSTMMVGILLFEYIVFNGNVMASLPAFMIWAVILVWSVRHLEEQDRNPKTPITDGTSAQGTPVLSVKSGLRRAGGFKGSR